MIVADRAESVRRCFHRVASDSTVNVQIDESRREKISIEINYLFAVVTSGFPQFGNSSLVRDQLEAIRIPSGKIRRPFRKIIF